MSKEKKESGATKELGWWGADPKDGDGKSGEIKVVGSSLYFYSPVTAGSALSLNEELKKLEVKLRTQAVENGTDPAPIQLHIHSYGGSIFAGISAMEAIRQCSVPVTTIVDGAAASAATFLSTAGHRRIVNKNAYMLIHQLSSVMWGKFQEFEDEMKNLNELMDMIARIYRERTGIPPRKLKRILKHDLWFNSAKCLKYGLVDEIG